VTCVLYTKAVARFPLRYIAALSCSLFHVFFMLMFLHTADVFTAAVFQCSCVCAVCHISDCSNNIIL